jgi:hypothetical protein
MLGRNILSSEDVKGELRVRIYDVLAGKDLWKQTYAPGSILMKSVDPRFVGVIDEKGGVHVTDLNTHKEVMTGTLDDVDGNKLAHVDKAVAVYLLSDRDHFYLAINGPADGSVAPWGGGVQSSLQLGSGLQAVPINGELYCYRRATGERAWRRGEPVRNQMLVTSRFADMPVVLCTAHYMELVGPGRAQVNRSYCLAIDKQNGKLIYDNKSVPAGLLFHELTLDPRAGKVELGGPGLKVAFQVSVAEK